MPYDAGERDRYVRLETRTPAVDSVGAPTDGDWSTLRSDWAAIVAITGRERMAASQEAASADTRWRLRYHLDMDPEVVDVASLRRLVYQGRVYDIVSAQQLGRRDGIELMTISRSA
jgi:SPP1 family predicted phage head-tail adaptor